jgi:hypothetical protein
MNPNNSRAHAGPSPADLEAVVAIDAKLAGRARRTPYFKRRLDAALLETETARPVRRRARGRTGRYVLTRRLIGEFGRLSPRCASK